MSVSFVVGGFDDWLLQVKGRLDDAIKSAGKMTEAANEFDSWLSHVNDLIADTEKQVRSLR